MAALPAVFGNLLPVHRRSRFPWQSALAGPGNGPADHAAVLFAAAARCARGAAGAGAAQAGGAGAAGHSRLVCALVGAPAATGHCGCRGGRAGRHRLGAFRFAKVGAWFALLFTIALVVLLALAAVALRISLSAESHAPAFAFVAAPWPGQSLSARKSVRAVLAALGTGVMLILAVYLMQGSGARPARDRLAQSAECFPDRRAQRRGCGREGVLRASAGRQPAAEMMPVVMGGSFRSMASRWSR